MKQVTLPALNPSSRRAPALARGARFALRAARPAAPDRRELSEKRCRLRSCTRGCLSGAGHRLPRSEQGCTNPMTGPGLRTALQPALKRRADASVRRSTLPQASERGERRLGVDDAVAESLVPEYRRRRAARGFPHDLPHPPRTWPSRQRSSVPEAFACGALRLHSTV